MNRHLHIFLGLFILGRQWHDLAPPGRVIPSSYIPNIRPQVDLNLFTSVEYIVYVYIVYWTHLLFPLYSQGCGPPMYSYIRAWCTDQWIAIAHPILLVLHGIYRNTVLKP